jgi:hypothetical protein
MPAKEAPESKIIAFRRSHRPITPLTRDKIENRFCIVCGAYGCVARYVTSPERGGELAGDNILPVCGDCAKLPMAILYANHSTIRRWLREHERLDVSLYLERALMQNGVKPQSTAHRAKGK